MAFLKIVLFAIIIMAIVMIGLGIQTFFSRRKKFPNTHIGSNPYLKEHGVTCAQTYDKMEQAKVRKELRFQKLSFNDTDDKENNGKGFS